jgi:selenocysteine lyase/cysteine desulfurase
LGATIYGVSDENAVAKRVPTICFTLDGVTPQAFATHMGEAGVGLRDGHLFAPRLMARLGLSMDSGAIRVSLVHYNTIDEIRRFEQIAERVLVGLKAR